MTKFEFLKDLGAGSFGLTKLMMDKETQELVAVKFIERGPKVTKNVAREIINHRSLRHPNIVRFKEVLLTPTHLLIVMEYASKGELYDHVINAGRFSEAEARFFFQQLISGVFYCHTMDVSHGDLKLANILVDGNPARKLKICDFGYSLSSSRRSKAKSITGTLRYIAPEVLSGGEYDGKLADIWSCGVTLYVMLVGAYPFANEVEPEDIEKTTQCILGAQYKIPANINISEECRDLLSRIFLAPAKRIKIQEIKSNPWFLKKLPRELSDAAQAKNRMPKASIFTFFQSDDIREIVEEAKKPGPPIVSYPYGRLIWKEKKYDDYQETVELEVEGEEVYKSEGLSVSGAVRLPERSLILNQFHSNHTDPSPQDPSMFGVRSAERSTDANHIHSYHLDSAVSQSVTYAVDSSMYLRLPERSVESNISHSYRSELSYPSISSVRSNEKSINTNFASELSYTKIWGNVTRFDPSISDVRKAEKSTGLYQLHYKLHEKCLTRGSFENLSISYVRSAEKSVESSSHFDRRGQKGNGKGKGSGRKGKGKANRFKDDLKDDLY